jgi:predicted transcriptional regulator
MRTKKDMSAFATSILKVFALNPFQPMNFKQIASRLGITDKGSKEMIKNHLNQMSQDEIIIEVDRGKYKLNPKYCHLCLSTLSNRLKVVLNKMKRQCLDLKMFYRMS